MSFFGIFSKKTKLKLDFLFVGLGNPDIEYHKNRHNIGWMVADKIALEYNLNLKFEKRYSAFFGTKEVNGKTIGILKPTTYMNRSGQSISKVLEYYDVYEGNILIIVDEFNFPLAKLHLKVGGSDGGHNGINSVMNYLPNNLFLRLRCGIDKNFGPGELVDYVLSDFNQEETEKLNLMISNAFLSVDFLLNNPLPKATSLINSGSLWENKEKPQSKNAIDNNKNNT